MMMMTGYDKDDEKNNEMAMAAFGELSHIFATAVVLFVMVSFVINALLGVLGVALGGIPFVGWMASVGIFAFKFWIVEYLMHNLGKWIPGLAPFLPPPAEGSMADMMKKKTHKPKNRYKSVTYLNHIQISK